MKRHFLIYTTIIISMVYAHSQEVVRLYEGKAPGSENWDYQEIEFYNSGTNTRMLRNVVDPTLEVYVPDESISNGTAVIICPGGGNVWLSYESEGTAVAEWLVKKGFTAFVLKYRLNKTPIDKSEFNEFWNNFGRSLKKEKGKKVISEKPVFYGGDDGIKAVQYVRANCESYDVDPNKIGMIGFSAGAGVTMHTILNVSPEDQLNFAGLIYGGWLNDAEVPVSAPPVFILCAADDFIAANSPEVFKAWRGAGKSAELHVYSKGGHGFGMDKKNLPVDGWIDRFHEWLSLTVLIGE